MFGMFGMFGMSGMRAAIVAPPTILTGFVTNGTLEMGARHDREAVRISRSGVVYKLAPTAIIVVGGVDVP